MSVSRSAIAKWESDKGMPDVNNLKVMAQLLNVSVDYLLDEDEKLSFNETKEAIDLESYEVTGKCRNKKDAACYSRFSDADAIYSLIKKKKLSKAENILEWTVMPAFGIFEAVDQLNDSCSYYFVESNGKQLLVKVSSDFITTCVLANKVDQKKFGFGNYTFKKLYQLI